MFILDYQEQKCRNSESSEEAVLKKLLFVILFDLLKK